MKKLQIFKILFSIFMVGILISTNVYANGGLVRKTVSASDDFARTVLLAEQARKAQLAQQRINAMLASQQAFKQSNNLKKTENVVQAAKTARPQITASLPEIQHTSKPKIAVRKKDILEPIITSSDLEKPPVLGVVQSRVNIANGSTRYTPLRGSGEKVPSGFNHVLEGHFNRPIENNRSVFSISQSELKSILQSKTVIRSPVTLLNGGQYIRRVDVGRIVGNTSLKQGGTETSRLNIFTDRAGNLLTAYPVK